MSIHTYIFKCVCVCNWIYIIYTSMISQGDSSFSIPSPPSRFIQGTDGSKDSHQAQDTQHFYRKGQTFVRDSLHLAAEAPVLALCSWRCLCLTELSSEPCLKLDGVLRLVMFHQCNEKCVCIWHIIYMISYVCIRVVVDIARVTTSPQTLTHKYNGFDMF